MIHLGHDGLYDYWLYPGSMAVYCTPVSYQGSADAPLTLYSLYAAFLRYCPDNFVQAVPDGFVLVD